MVILTSWIQISEKQSIQKYSKFQNENINGERGYKRGRGGKLPQINHIKTKQDRYGPVSRLP